METIKEIFGAIKAQLSERLANPFTGAFCIAWVIWNFRLLMVFAGKGSYREKFDYIDSTLYPDWQYWVARGVVIPVVTAVVYLWVYPRATRWLAEDYRKQQTRANNLMKAAEGAALLSVEESRALRARFAEAEQAWNVERDRLNLEVDASKEAAADLAKSNGELRTELARTAKTGAESGNESDPIQVAVTEVLSPNREEGNSRASSTKRYKVSAANANLLSVAAAEEQYTARQLQVLSLLRGGKRLGAKTLISLMQEDAFEVQRALDRLKTLGLVLFNNGEQVYGISAMGRATLGALMDEGKWYPSAPADPGGAG